jgi:hypothetical protein
MIRIESTFMGSGKAVIHAATIASKDMPPSWTGLFSFGLMITDSKC